MRLKAEGRSIFVLEFQSKFSKSSMSCKEPTGQLLSFLFYLQCVFSQFIISTVC